MMLILLSGDDAVFTLSFFVSLHREFSSPPILTGSLIAAVAFHLVLYKASFRLTTFFFFPKVHTADFSETQKE
jgi:hypothetical protein